MENNFLSFRKFNSLEQAEQLIDIFTNNQISYTLEDETLNYDPSSLNGFPIQKTIMVKIKPSDFSKAEKLLAQVASQNLEEVDKDHYLFNFKEEELIDILMKPDEWSPYDYELSKKILKDKGKEINPEDLEKYRMQRIEDLTKEEPHQHIWIYIGYILSLLGGLGGIFIGWYLMSFKKKLPDGNLVFAYNNEDRTHGKIIFICGILAFLCYVYIKINSDIELMKVIMK